MANLIEIPTYADSRGSLTVIEKILPFDIKRIFFIYGVDDSIRGGHRHYKTIQMAFCIKGSCVISTNDSLTKKDYLLNLPSKGLIINPKDWHTMHHFSRDAVLMVVASEFYDPSDYIWNNYS